MPVQVYWGDPARASILLRLERGWTWDELSRAVAQADTMITSVAHRVDLIVDLRQSAVPRDFLNGAKDLFAQGEARSNEGQRVVVGAGWGLKAAYQALLRLYADQLAVRPFHFADTLEEARQMLQRQP